MSVASRDYESVDEKSLSYVPIKKKKKKKKKKKSGGKMFKRIGIVNCLLPRNREKILMQ